MDVVVWTWRKKKKNIEMLVQFSETELGRYIRNVKAAVCCFIATLFNIYIYIKHKHMSTASLRVLV